MMPAMKKITITCLLFLAFWESKAHHNPPLSVSTYTKDPTRTPKEPKQADPVITVDGSQGKYRNKHKIINSKSWGRRRGHADLAKPKKGKEKSKNKTQSQESGS